SAGPPHRFTPARRGDLSLPGRSRKRTRINLIAYRFIRLIRHPTAVRRESRGAVVEARVKENERLPISIHWQHPHVKLVLRIIIHIQKETAVRRKIESILVLRRIEQQFLAAGAARWLHVDIERAFPV